MARTITHPDELKGRPLNYGDHVIFAKDLKYKVGHSHLSIQNLNCNSTIFKKLGIDQFEFLSKHYGYRPNDEGLWHNSRDRDYEALTRAAVALFVELGKPPTMKYTYLCTSYTVVTTHTDFLSIVKSEGRCPLDENMLPIISVHKSGRRFVLNKEIYNKESAVVDALVDSYSKGLWDEQ